MDLRGGLFTGGPSIALVAGGVFEDPQTLVIAFGGSAGPSAWLAGLRDIDQAYEAFQPLVRAIERHVAAGGRVVLVGYSLGGAIVQLIMYGHAGQDGYRAVTFGSPGALPKPRQFARKPDPRLTNYVIADDPFVFLGEHRAEMAAYGLRHPIYGLAVAEAVSHESGLGLAQVLGATKAMSANYANNGGRVVLPGRRRAPTLATVLMADPDDHDIESYLAHAVSGAFPDVVLWPVPRIRSASRAAPERAAPISGHYLRGLGR